MSVQFAILYNTFLICFAIMSWTSLIYQLRCSLVHTNRCYNYKVLSQNSALYHSFPHLAPACRPLMRFVLKRTLHTGPTQIFRTYITRWVEECVFQLPQTPHTHTLSPGMYLITCVSLSQLLHNRVELF